MIDLKVQDAQSLGIERTLTKGFLPPEVNHGNSDLGFYVNRFPQGDIENFSLARASLAMSMTPQRGDAWDYYAPWEKAYYAALANVSVKALGDQISGQDGAYLAPEFWSSKWFDLLRSQSALDRLPVTRVTMPYRTIKMPRVIGDITVSYPGENTAPTSTVFQLGQISLTARKAMAIINISNEEMEDAPEVADQVLRMSSAGAIATDRDKQAFTSNDFGLVSNSTIPGYTLAGDSGNGASPDYPNDWVGIVDTVRNLSTSASVTAGQADCDGIVGNTRVAKTIHSLRNAVQSPIWGAKDLEAAGGFLGVKKWPLVGTGILPTNIVKGTSNDTSYLIAGWWRQYVLFECLTLGYSATQQAQGFASAYTQVRIVHRWHGAAAHPEAFLVVKGVRA